MLVNFCDLELPARIIGKESLFRYIFDDYHITFYRDEETNDIYICLDDIYHMFDLYNKEFILKDKDQFIHNNQEVIKEIDIQCIDNLSENKFSNIYQKTKVEFITLKGLDILFPDKTIDPIIFFYKWVKFKTAPYITKLMVNSNEGEAVVS